MCVVDGYTGICGRKARLSKAVDCLEWSLCLEGRGDRDDRGDRVTGMIQKRMKTEETIAAGLMPPRISTRQWSESQSHWVVSDPLWPHRLYSPWNSPGQNTGVGSLSLLQGIFPTPGPNPSLPYYRRILYQLKHKGSPGILERLAYPFSSRSSRPRNPTRVSCVAGGFFTDWTIWGGAKQKNNMVKNDRNAFISGCLIRTLLMSKFLLSADASWLLTDPWCSPSL